MFSLLKKLWGMLCILILIFFNYGLGNVIKNVSGNLEMFTRDKPNCYLLKNQECKVRKVIFFNVR